MRPVGDLAVQTLEQADLIARARGGDPGAQRELFERHAPRVRSIALHFFGHDASSAGDVVQEVFVKLLTRLDQFRDGSQFTTWLHRLVVNACLDEKRARRRLVAIDDTGHGDAPSRAPGPHDEASRGERARRVRRAVGDLPPRLRIAVLLRHFEDLSYEEMAQALGCSKGTVASRLSRGHAALARSLESMREVSP
jgi:RNA polymerase sigma-70 factor (ECF subfamily)